MRTTCEYDEQVKVIWELCVAAYIRHGRRLQFPSNTDVTKTYQWRYASAITKKFNDLKFDNSTAEYVIDLAVAHAKQTGTMRKGLASILQNNLIDICCEKLKNESTSYKQAVDSIISIHLWLKKKVNGQDPLTVLRHRNSRDEFCNLTMWSQASYVTPIYLALSKTCSAVLDELTRYHPYERQLLPKQTSLYILKTDFLKDKNNLKKIAVINNWSL